MTGSRQFLTDGDLAGLHTDSQTPAISGSTGSGSTHKHTVIDPGHAHGGFSGSANINHLLAFPQMPAAGVLYHAAYAGGAGAIDDFLGPWTQFSPARTVRIHGDVLTAAATWTIDGLTFQGIGISEVIVHPGGAVDVDGIKGFGSITRVRSSVDPGAGASVEVQSGPGWCVGFLSGLFGVLNPTGVDGIGEALTSLDLSTGTVVFTTPPNGAHNYFVHIAQFHGHVISAGATGVSTDDEAKHTHPVGTLVQAAHSHALV